MNILIDDMLRLSNISRQKMVIQEIDLSAVAKAVVKELEQQHRKKMSKHTLATILRHEEMRSLSK